MNERTIELIDIAPKDFWGAQDTHLETIKKYYPKLRIVARGTTIKAFGETEVLDEFENRFNRLMQHFTRYNKIDDNVIERVIEGNGQAERMDDRDKILVHGIHGKIIKAITPNQQLLVDMINKNDMVFAVGPAGTGKTYTGVALAVKALKEKQVKRIILTRPAVEAGENLGFLPGDMKEKLDMGKSAKFMITGDPGQIDLPRRQVSGLKEAMLVLKDIEGISIIYLDDKDIVRHRLVKKVIDAYKRIENND